MRACRIIIENFRGIKKAEIPLPEHCVLIGPNNCGKTAIAQGLALVIGRERWLHNITEYDFHGANPIAADRFNIIVTLTDFHPKIQDPTIFPEWFNTEKGARVAWWTESTKTISYELDPPENSKLALEIAATGRYDNESCEFEVRRYFYDGKIDPFAIDPFIGIPNNLLAQIGLFLIPCLRHWDRLLSFGSGQFLKLLREIDSLPAEELNAIKEEIRNPQVKLENSNNMKGLLQSLENELQCFSLITPSSNIVYRPTQLSIHSLLDSLLPHVANQNETIIPFSKQGDGFASVQLLLLLLQFAQLRKEAIENTIFIAEEPELHLHSSLQRRLINRLRAYSTQTIVTTHSQHIATMYKPSEVIFLTNNDGVVESKIVFPGNVHDSGLGNQVRQLYLRERQNFYEALLGQYILIPEGKWDWQWFHLFIRVAEATASEGLTLESIQPDWSLSSLQVIHTNDSAVTPFVKELRRFRSDVVALIDGDTAGHEKLITISHLSKEQAPKSVVMFGQEGEIEDLAAWVLEPLLAEPKDALLSVLDSQPKPYNKNMLGNLLKLCERDGPRNKENWELHENLAWEAYSHNICRTRVVSFLSDIVRICSGQKPQLAGWIESFVPNSQIPLFTASFIRNSQ